VTILRPGQRIVTLGDWMRVSQPRGGAAADWWDPNGEGLSVGAAYQPKGAASYAASKINLANPGTYDAVEGAAPAWASGTGWIFGTNNRYLLTGITPQDGWSMFAQFTGANGSDEHVVVGSQDTTHTSRFYLRPRSSFASGRIYGQGSFVAITGYLTAGNMAVADQQGYLDGVADGGAIGAWSGTARPIIVGGLMFDATPISWFQGNVVAVAIYSSTLTAPQVAAVAAAMAAL